MKRFFLLLFLFLTAPLFAATQDLNITITWADNSNNEDGFKVQMKAGAGSYAQVGSPTGPNVTTFSTVVASDPGGVQYCARVVAFNSAGDAAPGPEGCGTSPGLVVVPTPAGPATIVINVGSIHP